MPDDLLVASGLSKNFRVSRGLFRPAALVRAVDEVSLNVIRGETLSIVGESGCGKSTLLRLLLRLIEPSTGSIRFDGRDLMALSKSEMRAQRPKMQMVFQDPYASLDPRMTIGAILAQPLALFTDLTAAARRQKVMELLDLVGLRSEYAQRYPHEFSGGQRQRIGIARALCLQPRIIMADEPVSALDVSIQAQIINLLKDLQKRFALSYVIVAHDLTVVQHISDRVAVMYLGRFVELAPTRLLFGAPRHPYTQGLMAAIPVSHPEQRAPKKLLQGDPPSPLKPPPGCHFHTRCPYVVERCRVETPALQLDADNHGVACHRWQEIPSPVGRAQIARRPVVQQRADILLKAGSVKRPVIASEAKQ